MKKVININFQGRVVPIEETAFEKLKQYIRSLRQYFAKEDGCEEIINDIENRIGELMDEQLKKGAHCIDDNIVEMIITNMGRIEDFEAQDEPENHNTNQQQDNSRSKYDYNQSNSGYSSKKLYRDENDKMIGGVASGVAHYLNIDPAFIRILFAILLIVGGSGVLLYLICWIILPSKPLQPSVVKRLYRSREERVVAGVCGGLGRYFNISTTTVRVVFAAPFILSVIAGIGNNIFNEGFAIAGGFGGGMFVLTYIVLWIAVPEANTRSEKMAMRGEEMNVNNIKNTVLNEIKTVRESAEKVGREVKDSIQQAASDVKASMGNVSEDFKTNISTSGSRISEDIKYAVNRNKSGIGAAIGMTFKAIAFVIMAIVGVSLFILLISLIIGGVNILPFKEFIINSGYQNMLTWGTIIFFFGVPIVGLITWIIRSIANIKTGSRYINLSIFSLWIVGWICAILLLTSVMKDYSYENVDEIAFELPVTNPDAKDALIVKVANPRNRGNLNFIKIDGLDYIGRDSAGINSIRVNVLKSADTNYHVSYKRFSSGFDADDAYNRLLKIDFKAEQVNNILYLPSSFAVSKNEKWRGQSVMVVIEVPIGKKIKINNSVSRYNDFGLDYNDHSKIWNLRTDAINDENKSWWYGYNYRYDREYIMTDKGLVSLDKRDEEEEVSEGLDGDSIRLQEINPFRKQKENERVNDTVPHGDTNTVVETVEVKIAGFTQVSNCLNTNKNVSKVEISHPLAIFDRLI